jgi:sporulation protein YlmC with PRC-barrel domain
MYNCSEFSNDLPSAVNTLRRQSVQPGKKCYMEIRFGRPVVSVDSDRAGTVEGLVLDKTCRIVRKIRLLHGTDERSIPYRSVTAVDADGIIDIELTAFEVQQSSLEHAEPDMGQSFVSYTAWVSGETVSPSFSPGVRSTDVYHPSEQEETESDEIEIDGENVVAGPDGKVVGTIAGVDADETGRISELIISTGFLRPDLRVNMESVDYIEGSYVSQAF